MGLTCLHVIRTVAILLTVCSSAFANERQHHAKPPPLDEAPEYARINWLDHVNPHFIALDNDQFLLETKQGIQRWDVHKNTFTAIAGWPDKMFLSWAWAPLGNGKIVQAISRDRNTPRINQLLWWDAQQQTFSTPLSQRSGVGIARILPLDAKHAVVCTNPESFPDLKRPAYGHARMVQLEQGQLAWVDEPSQEHYQALENIDVRGEIEHFPNRSGGPTEPVYFDADACDWRIRNPPEEIATTGLSVQHYRLSNGQYILAFVDWHDQASGIRKQLTTPLLWDSTTQNWHQVERTSASLVFPSVHQVDRNGPGIVGVDRSFTFVERLDVSSMHWLRSKQLIRKARTFSPLAVPLATGQVLVFERSFNAPETGAVFLLDMSGTVPHKRLFSTHGRYGQLKLKDGRVMLAAGGTTWSRGSQVQMIDTRRLQATVVAPMPEAISHMSGVELLDGSALFFGGTPPRCGPDHFGKPCSEKPATASYRYFPKADRWEWVPNLNIPFANGWFWDTGNSEITSQWPRQDALVRRNGDFVYLDSGNHWQSETLSPTRVMHWRPGSPPNELAPLQTRRTHATLLELKATRSGKAHRPKLVILGGFERKQDQSTQGPFENPMVSTEYFDDHKKRWLPGPSAHYPGGAAFKLANGRIFKLSLKSGFSEHGYQAEIADAAFRRWYKLPPLIEQPRRRTQGERHNALTEVVAAGNRVYLVYGSADRRTVYWDDNRRRWIRPKPWPSDAILPNYLLPLDGRRLLIRTGETFDVIPYPN